MIIVSHDAHNIREHCTRACVLQDGVLREFADIDAAYLDYNQSEPANA
jgi:capsular polysaccharide transport system ATP-binding protein